MHLAQAVALLELANHSARRVQKFHCLTVLLLRVCSIEQDLQQRRSTSAYRRQYSLTKTAVNRSKSWREGKAAQLKSYSRCSWQFPRSRQVDTLQWQRVVHRMK